MPSLVTERIESVKAGFLSAGAFTLAELVLVSAKLILAKTVLEYDLAVTTVDWQLLIQILFGAASGFLFGVTYRYVIRDDQNSHLNDGAVLAFSLVRGLALIEDNLILFELVYVLFLVLESVVCFAIARFTLDFAIARKFIKPYI